MVILSTGQTRCYSPDGELMPCAGSGQDGEYRSGEPSPRPRFDLEGDIVTDLWTGLGWSRNANLTGAPVRWAAALHAVGVVHKSAARFNVWPDLEV